jgi:predicted DNA-binding transcriptional regulator AlpA
VDRVLRRSELKSVVGLGRTQIDNLIAKGEFPAPIPLSDHGRAVGWFESEILAWQKARLAKRDGGAQ